MKKFLFVLICSALFGLNQMKAQNLTVHIQGIEQDKGKVFVALFNSQETWLKQSFKSLEQDVTGATCTVTFTDLPKGEYAIAIFHDENGNGKWDTGDYDTKKQPEEVYYYPYDFQLRQMWDAEEYWHYKEIPILEQKPQALKKEVNNKKQN